MDQDNILQDCIFKMDILMWRVIKLLVKCRKHVLERFGLTCSQFDILSAISYFSTIKEEIIQIDLAEKTGIDPMTTSTILRNLERKRLITRHRDTRNTRTVIVKLTNEGFNLLNEAYLQIRFTNMQIYEDVDSEVFTAQLLKLISKINN